MLRLSKKADYALIAMKHLALHSDRGASSAREIAEAYDIPIELLAKVLQRLVRRGLLASHHGTHGGYRLARQAGLVIESGPCDADALRVEVDVDLGHACDLPDLAGHGGAAVVAAHLGDEVGKALDGPVHYTP